MLSILIKNKLKTLSHSIASGTVRQKTGKIAGYTVAVVFFISVLYYSNKLINFLYSSLSKDMTELILNKAAILLLSAGFIFVLLTGIATTLFTMFLSKDLNFLMSLPINRRIVFVYKYLESYFVNSLIIFVVLLPFLVTYGYSSVSRIAYYPVMIISLMLLFSLPTSFGILIGMAAVRIINPNRAREILGVVGGLVGLVFFIGSQAIPRFLENNINSLAQTNPSSIVGLIDRVLNKTFLKFLPSTWAANTISSTHGVKGIPFLMNFTFLFIASILLFLVCIYAADRIYYSGWASASQFLINRVRKRGLKTDSSGSRLKIFKGNIFYIMVKDFKLLYRDLRKIIQIIIPVFMLIFIFLYSILGKKNGLPPVNIIFMDLKILIFLTFPLLISGFVNIGVSGNSIGAEGLRYWILKVSPFSTKNLLKVKIFFGSIISSVSGILACVITYFAIKPGNISFLFLGFLSIIIYSYGFSTVAVSIGAIFPEFKPEYQKKNNVTSLGSILLLVSMVVYFIISAGIIISGFAMVYFLKISNFIAIFLIPFILEVIIVLILYNTILRLASSSLSKIEWKY
jgi:ABC-2 type transport system permease protein